MGYMDLLDYKNFELKQFAPINSFNETRPFKTYLYTTIRNWGHSFLTCIYNFIMNSIENGEIASWDEARGIIAELRERAHELNKDHEYYIHPDYRTKQKMETYRDMAVVYQIRKNYSILRRIKTLKLSNSMNGFSYIFQFEK